MTIFTGAELDAEEFAPLHWCVEGMIPEGTGIIAGPPKIGKSWMVSDIALACAGGGTALGHFPAGQRPVLYLALEDQRRRLQDRFRQLLGGKPIPGGLALCIDVDTAIAAATKFLTDHADSAPLVILDTLGKVLPPNAAKNCFSEDYQRVSALMKLQQAAKGSTFLIVHHTRKAEAADHVHQVSGTTGITAAADFVIVVHRERTDSKGELHVTGRDIPEATYGFTMTGSDDGYRWSIDPKSHKQAAEHAERQRGSERTNAIFRHVRDHGPSTPAEIAEALGLEPKQVSGYLRRMVKRGLLVQTERGYIRLNVLKVLKALVKTVTQFNTKLTVLKVNSTLIKIVLKKKPILTR